MIYLIFKGMFNLFCAYGAFLLIAAGYAHLKKALFVLWVLVICLGLGITTGCGRKASVYVTEECNVSKEGSKATIKCPDGSSVELHDGVNGTNGNDGTAGQKGDQGIGGQTGSSGTNGTLGQNGQDGLISLISLTSTSSCVNGGITVLSGLDTDRNGVLSPGEITASAQICNGVNGSNGSNGVDGHDGPPTEFTPVAVIDPCGDASGIYDEVLLRLSNGIILASFSDNTNGQNTRFSIIGQGSYMTTDGSGCHFSIDAAGNVL